MVVINCTTPEVKMPKELIQVKNQIVPKPVTIANNEFEANAGMKVLKALIKETVIAALVHHTETKSRLLKNLRSHLGLFENKHKDLRWQRVINYLNAQTLLKLKKHQ